MSKYRRVRFFETQTVKSLLLFHDFLPISRYISETMQDIAIVTIEGE